jgi:UDP-N-acetylglucosamine 1-carboxyvinyltransferase
MAQNFQFPADRIEAGTYLIAAAITGGDVTISNVQAPRMNNILDKLKLSGASVIVGDDTIQLIMENDSILPGRYFYSPISRISN